MAGDLCPGRGFVIRTRLCNLRQHVGVLLRLDRARVGGPRNRQHLWPGLSAGFDTRQRPCAGQTSGFAGNSPAAAGPGWLHRRHAGPGLDHPRPRPGRVRGRHRCGAAFSHGAGAQPLAAPSHRTRPGLGGRLLPAPAPSEAGTVAGPPDRHAQLQVRGVVQRAFWSQSEPQRGGPVGVGQPGRRPDRRALRYRRLSGPPGRAVQRPL